MWVYGHQWAWRAAPTRTPTRQRRFGLGQQSRCRCGRSKPSPGADVGGAGFGAAVLPTSSGCTPAQTHSRTHMSTRTRRVQLRTFGEHGTNDQQLNGPSGIAVSGPVHCTLYCRPRLFIRRKAQPKTAPPRAACLSAAWCAVRAAAVQRTGAVGWCHWRPMHTGPVLEMGRWDGAW